MTRRIWADEKIAPPRPVFAEFRCDGDHGLLPAPVLTVELGPDKDFSWPQAYAAGWSITPECDLCPECRL